MCVEEPIFEAGRKFDPDRGSAIARIVAEELVRAEFAVVQATRTSEIVSRERARMSPLYDVDSGRRDEARYAEFQARSRAALHAELGCELVARLTVAAGIAAAPGMDVAWDGVWDKAFGGAGRVGLVGVLSLRVSLRAMDGREVYFGTGGIELSREFDPNPRSLRSLPRPVPDLLRDETRIRRATQAALQPYLGGKATLVYGNPRQKRAWGTPARDDR